MQVQGSGSDSDAGSNLGSRCNPCACSGIPSHRIRTPLANCPRRCSLPSPLPPLSAAVQPYERPASHGLQYYSPVPGEDVVGQPYRHMAADEQVGCAYAGVWTVWGAVHKHAWVH